MLSVTRVAATVLPIAAILLGGCASGKKTLTQKQEATLQWNRTRAAVMFGLARDQFQNGNYENSRQTLDEALKLDPENPQLHVLGARVAIELNHLDQADASLARARTIDAKNVDAVYLSGVVAQRWQKWDDALAYYATASELAPSELDYLLAKAEMLLTLDRRSEALRMLQDKIVFFDHSSALRDAIGQLLMQEKCYAQAAEMFRQGSVLSPDEPALRERLAWAVYYAGDFREAAEQFGRLTSAEPYASQAPPFIALGEAQFALGKFADARSSFTTAVALTPANVDANLGVARAALELNDLTRAELSVRKALSLDPSSAPGHLALGYIRVRQNRLADAGNEFVKASSCDRKDPVSLCMIGYVLAKTGHADEALEFYGRALNLNPNDELATKLMATAGVD